MNSLLTGKYRWVPALGATGLYCVSGGELNEFTWSQQL